MRLGTLDSYCEQHNITHIQLLKLDVEGHELDVLAGGQKLFEDRKVDMVPFEFGGCNIDTRTFLQDFWYFFTQYDMQLYRIMANATLYPITQYEETMEQFITTNYIAITKHCEIPYSLIAH